MALNQPILRNPTSLPKAPTIPYERRRVTPLCRHAMETLSKCQSANGIQRMRLAMWRRWSVRRAFVWIFVPRRNKTDNRQIDNRKCDQRSHADNRQITNVMAVHSWMNTIKRFRGLRRTNIVNDSHNQSYSVQSYTSNATRTTA